MIVRSFALLLAVSTFATASLAPSEALANGRFPSANQMVSSPRSADELVLRATFGILFSSDRGKTWDWICERAVGYGNVWDPPIGVFASGAVMAGTIDGLALSADHGCQWALIGGALEKRAMYDVVVRPESPSAGFALGSSNAGKSDAGAQLFSTELFGTQDNGNTWALVSSAFAPDFTAQTLEVAKSDAKRVYVSGGIGDRGLVYVSTDGGVTFEDRTVPLEKPAERYPFIAAVDPENADRFYVRTSGTTTRLLVTDDAGKTYKTIVSGPPLLGFALAPDGKRVWVGSTAGLSVADTTAFAFAKIGDAGVQCLLATTSELYACFSDASLGYSVGVSGDGGKSFRSLLVLKDIRGPLACPDTSASAVCVEDWPSVRAALDPPPASPDAGTTRDAGPSTLGLYRAEGGCNVAGGASKRWLSWGPPFAALGLFALRRALRARTRPFRGSR